MTNAKHDLLTDSIVSDLCDPIVSRVGRALIVNVTPHAITFAHCDHESWCTMTDPSPHAPDVCGGCGNDLTISVPPSGVIISALAFEREAGAHASGAALVRTEFRGSTDGDAALVALEAAYPSAVIVGSIIAAQAFPGRVLAMVPAPGFERVPPAEKRMRADKFTTFAED